MTPTGADTWNERATRFPGGRTPDHVARMLRRLDHVPME